MRNDIGALWENFVISERMKFNSYSERFCNSWFWRTAKQQEIDYIEEKGGLLTAFEFKYNSLKRVKMPITFSKAYPDAKFLVVSPENIEAFLLG